MGGSQQNPSKEINEPSSERGQDFGGVGDYVVPAPSTPKPTGISYYEEVYLERWPSMSKWRSRTRIMVVLDMVLNNCKFCEVYFFIYCRVVFFEMILTN